MAYFQTKFEKRRYWLDQPRQKPKAPFQLGDWVTSRKPPAEVSKGANPRSAPKQVTEVLGRWTYKLSDGQTWNAKKLKGYRCPTMQQVEMEQHIQAGNQQPLVVPRPVGQLNVPPLPPGSRRSTRANLGVPPERFSPGWWQLRRIEADPHSTVGEHWYISLWLS